MSDILHDKCKLKYWRHLVPLLDEKQSVVITKASDPHCESACDLLKQQRIEYNVIQLDRYYP